MLRAVVLICGSEGKYVSDSCTKVAARGCSKVFTDIIHSHELRRTGFRCIVL